MVDSIQGGMSLATEQFAQMREKMFARLDTDGDGQIDLAALQSEMEQSDSTDSVHLSRMLEHLTEADTDGDGMVSKTEFEAMKPPPPPPPPEESGESSFSSLLYSMLGENEESEDLTGRLLDTLG